MRESLNILTVATGGPTTNTKLWPLHLFTPQMWKQTNKSHTCGVLDLLSVIHSRPQLAVGVTGGPCSWLLSAPEKLRVLLRDRGCFLGIHRILLVVLPNWEERGREKRNESLFKENWCSVVLSCLKMLAKILKIHIYHVYELINSLETMHALNVLLVNLD